MPILEFKKSPNELFSLMDKLANNLAIEIQRYQQKLKNDPKLVNVIKKLEEEFNVICALNALYGNPNVHLIQLHP